MTVYNESPLNWLATIGIGMMVIILLFMNTNLIISIIKFVKQTKRRNSLVTALTIFLFTLIAILLFASGIIMLILNTNSSKNAIVAVLGIPPLGLYGISLSLMTLVFTMRIDLTFKGSGFEYSKCVIKALYIASISMLIIILLIIPLLTFQLYAIAILLALLWSLLYVSLCIILMILFIRKMEFMMMQKVLNETPSTTKTESTTGQKQEEIKDETRIEIKAMIDNNFLYIVIKHGLLVPIAILSSFICLFIELGSAYLMDPNALHIISLFWNVVDCTINSLCIYLLFGFNKNIYDKICSGMHKFCEKCKLSQIKRKHKRKFDDHDVGDEKL